MPAADLCWAVVALWRALERGDFARAYEISAPLSALIAMQTSLDAFVAIEKHLLVRQGVIPRALCRGPAGFAIEGETLLEEVDRLFRSSPLDRQRRLSPKTRGRTLGSNELIVSQRRGVSIRAQL